MRPCSDPKKTPAALFIVIVSMTVIANHFDKSKYISTTKSNNETRTLKKLWKLKSAQKQHFLQTFILNYS